MDKTYQPQEIEKKWIDLWEKLNCFAPSYKGDPYSIVIPPPNVTGSLHMGHGFQHTLMDILIRYNRMQKFNTLWQVGTDHAGIATQMVVTQQLINQGKNPYQLSRDDFVEEVFKWKEQSKTTINHQMRRLGISVDWAKERFTMDEGLSKAVHKVFIDLYNEGLIYRGKRLVNWDPSLNTAVSDLEVTSEEQDGFLWYINYPIINNDHKNTKITVATTRPETMLGDTAVAIHPEDERYKHLIGCQIQLPLCDRTIPIIADDMVDPEFGTGCVKITPAHDFNDYEIGQRHNLPIINIFTQKAAINENAPSVYYGMDRFKARKQIIKDLKEKGLLEKIVAHKLKVPHGDRTDAVIEPMLTDQWFVKIKPLAEQAIKAVEKGDIKFIPENWSKVYLQWLYKIEDWCISRQLMWGHRIPAWHDEAGNIYVADNEQEVRKQYNLPDSLTLTQDNDVLDTWFSSALWPFSSLGWPEDTVDYTTFFPTNVLVTGFDIIFFWVARMVMMSLKFTGKVPFKNVYITGLIRDKNGKKMSKSKGNIIDPIDLVDGITIEELIKKRTRNLMQQTRSHQITQATRKEFPHGIKAHGMDALRFTFCALASTTRNINFDVKRLEGYRNFCNKIWNASRFVSMNYQKQASSKNELSLIDKWIITRLQITIKEAAKSLKIYRFDLYAQTIYDFIWREFCDWYLEFYKIIPKTSDTIVVVLDNILRLLHPIMPFITEELWQQTAQFLGKKAETISSQPYPISDETQINNDATTEVTWLQEIISGIRNIRGEMNISPAIKLQIILTKGNETDKKYVANNEQVLMQLGKIKTITWKNQNELPPKSATFSVNKLEIHIPIADVVDVEAECKRVQKEINRLEKDIDRSQNKLENKDYIAKAPKEIVEKEQEKLQKSKTTLEKLQQQFAMLS